MPRDGRASHSLLSSADQIEEFDESEIPTRWVDPDPIVLFSLILTGVNTAASVANTVMRYLDRRSESPRRASEPLIRTLFFKLEAGLERLLAQARVLRRFLASNEIELSSKLRIGEAPISLDPATLETYRRLVQDCIEIVEQLHEDGIDLVLRLRYAPGGEQVSGDIQRAVNRINELRYVATYDDFLVGLEAGVGELHDAFTALSRLYRHADRGIRG